jgi:hypothetical protein
MLYEQVFGVAGYERAVRCVTELASRRAQRKQPLPLAVPEMIKTEQTMELMDGFFDGWLRQLGAAVIRGYNDHCGQLPNLAVSTMAPPNRRACRRIFSRMTILADGGVPACEQDFCGAYPMATLTEASLAEAWRTGRLATLREAQLRGEFSASPLCEACTQWHRP